MARGPTPARHASRRLRAVVFIDVVDSVRLIHQDQDATIERWRTFVGRAVHGEVPKRHGRVVKTTGDGMLIEFESALDAVDCAFAIRELIERSEASIPDERKIRLRMGLHLAEVFADELDIYGDGVNLAARLMQLGQGQEIIVSAALRDQLTNNLGVSIEDLGERELKGYDHPVRAFRILPPGEAYAPRAPPPGPRPPVVLPIRSPTGGTLSPVAQRPPSTEGRPSIAVLPFRNVSGDPAHDFLGDLVADDLIADLSHLTDLFVISRLSTTPFRDRALEPRAIAQALGVGYVLSGSLQVVGTKLRLRAELSEANAGRVAWSDRIDGALDGIFEMQQRLTGELTKRVVPRVRQLELERARSKRTEDLTAYERMLQAIDQLHRSSIGSFDAAHALLEAAIAADPQFVAPRAWLAYWHVRRVGQGWSPGPRDDASEALRHAEEALELDRNDPWALSVRGLVSAYLQQDLDGAINAYDRAIAINPNSVWAWVWSTSAYAWRGEGAEAVRRAPMAIELSPYDPSMYVFTSHAGSAHLAAGEPSRAIDYLERSLRENRMFVATHKLMTIALVLAGRNDEARRAAAELLALEPGFTVGSFRERYPGHRAPYAPRYFEALAAAGVPA
ncbi:MAG TPA: adenylate/guanylate cyclase domain-containing protein [Casimicrobiaceae bacterium]|nr:adenylate/guanylate cyclase domain-containing protein [Casimicrobiaceae bacterium]